MAVIETFDFKKEFVDIFNDPSSAYADSTNHGFVHCGTSLFKPNGFRIADTIPLNKLDEDIFFKQNAMVVNFTRKIATDMDGTYHGGDNDQFTGNDFIAIVEIEFMADMGLKFDYNGKVYRVSSIEKPSPDYDLKELVFWWVMKVLSDNKDHTGTNIDWVIQFDNPDYRWDYENLIEFSGFKLTIGVHFQIKTDPSGGA